MFPSRLDRYVFREIFGPFALGLLIYTFILLMNVLFEAAETIIRRDVSAVLVGRLLLLELPHIVVLTLPMAFLFAILIAIGRLSADSELVAMRASGISLFYLYRPILGVSVLLTCLNCFLMIWTLPWGNHARELLVDQILTRSVAEEIAPRVFQEFNDQVLYVFEKPQDDPRWKGVFLAEAIPKTNSSVTVAEHGQVLVEDEGTDLLLLLNGVTVQELDLNKPADLKVSRHGAHTRRLGDDDLSLRQSQSTQTKGVRELTWGELQERQLDPEFTPHERRLARVEMHKKFAIPAACLVFGLFGVPVGFNNRRGGRSSGFVISIAVILIYYVMLSNGEEAAALGHLPPWLAMWSANLLLTAVGTFLLARRNRDKSLLLTRLDRWIRHHLWRHLLGLHELWTRRQQRQHARDTDRRPGGDSPRAVLVRLPRLRPGFPNLFDRYLISLFCRVFVVVAMAGISVYMIAEFTELVEHILENKIPSAVVFDYLKFMSLQIFYQVAPVGVLVTTLVTFGLLSRRNEITAAKALGISLYRLAAPVTLTALMVAGLSALLETSVLPASNARVAQLKDQILGRDRVRNYRRADRQWLFGKGEGNKGGYIYNYLHYDAGRQALQRLHVFRFDERYRLTGRLFADQASFDEDSGWKVDGGRAYTFDGAAVLSYDPLPPGQAVNIPEQPEFFDSEVKSPEQMNFPELRAYIGELKEAGQNAPELEVELHNKIAMPVVCLVMALVALPFAFRLGKGGALYGIGLAIVLGMVFYSIIAFFSTLGAAAALPPAVAAWSPNVLFAALSLYLFLGLRT